MWRFVLAAGVLITLLVPATAAEDGCDKFAWPMARERTLLAAADKPVVQAGQTLAAIPKGAFVLNLQSGAEAAFAMPPERKPRAERWFGGTIRFSGLEKPGIYQVTLSEEAWIDVVQHDRYARSVGSTGRGDCPGLRKSVRLDLVAAPFVLQVSGVTSESIVVAISAVQKRYVLSDRGTWIHFKNKGDLAILVEGDKRMFNQYGVMLVNPAKHLNVKKELGQQFIDYLISAEGQKDIANYKINGEQLFYPNANDAGA